MSWRSRFLIIAHRGASAYEPENTIAAFRKAVELGADAIELDVRGSRDGVPVVIHDEDLKRVANIDKRVYELGVEEMKNFKVFGKEPIPTLDEVLAAIDDSIPLFIEIKSEGIEDKVVTSLREHNRYDNSLIISFNYRVLAKVRELDSRIDVGLLVATYPVPVNEALKLKAFAILPRYNIITPRTVKEIHSKNLRVYTWTINDASLALKLAGYDVDGIATDDPLIKNEIRKQYRLTKYIR